MEIPSSTGRTTEKSPRRLWIGKQPSKKSKGRKREIKLPYFSYSLHFIILTWKKDFQIGVSLLFHSFCGWFSSSPSPNFQLWSSSRVRKVMLWIEKKWPFPLYLIRPNFRYFLCETSVSERLSFWEFLVLNKTNKVGQLGKMGSSQCPPEADNPLPLNISVESWLLAEKTTDSIIRKIQPTQVSEERRKNVIEYIQKLVRGCLGYEVTVFF